MIEIDRNTLLLSTYRALLFNILQCTRFIYIDVKEQILNMSIYVDRELSDEEKDVYYSVAGEICGDFIKLENSVVNFHLNNLKFENNLDNGILVYARYE